MPRYTPQLTHGRLKGPWSQPQPPAGQQARDWEGTGPGGHCGHWESPLTCLWNTRCWGTNQASPPLPVSCLPKKPGAMPPSPHQWSLPRCKHRGQSPGKGPPPFWSPRPPRQTWEGANRAAGGGRCCQRPFQGCVAIRATSLRGSRKTPDARVPPRLPQSSRGRTPARSRHGGRAAARGALLQSQRFMRLGLETGQKGQQPAQPGPLGREAVHEPTLRHSRNPQTAPGEGLLSPFHRQAQ